MTDLLALWFHPASTPENLVLLLLRLWVGGFFFLFRFRMIWDPSQPVQKWFSPARYRKLHEACQDCHYPWPWLPWLITFAEVPGGLAIVFGLLTPLAALGVGLVCLFGTICNAKEQVAEQNPVDKVDCVCRYLWTSEPLLLVLSCVLLVFGGGQWSLDAVIAGWLL